MNDETDARENRTKRDPVVGERLVLIRDVDRYPHFIAARGSKGTITDASAGAVSLRLDDPLPGAEEWDNEIVWSTDFGQDIWREAEPLADPGGELGSAASAAREVVVYLPAMHHPGPTEGIVRGSAILGMPDPDSLDVRIGFEGAIYGQSGMDTLADRAAYAFGRLRNRYLTVAARVVPRGALVAVGTFDPRSGNVVLTGEQSAADVATWLGVLRVKPAELRPSGPAPDRGERTDP